MEAIAAKRPLRSWWTIFFVMKWNSCREHHEVVYHSNLPYRLIQIDALGQIQHLVRQVIK